MKIRLDSAFLADKPSQLCTKEVYDLLGDIENFIFYYNLKQAEQLALEVNLEY